MRIGLGLSIPELATRGGKFSPASLFTGGVVGAWYEPDDFSTLFQDSAGTTPVTAVEQPVGLMLDKSQGLVLGSELVTNGDFSSGTTGWSATGSSVLSVVSGALRVENGAAVTGGTTQTINTVAGRWYTFTYYVNPATTGSATVRVRDAVALTVLQSVSQTIAGVYTYKFAAIGSTTQVQCINGAATLGVYSEIDNISVKELPGNHASQATPTSRPVLRARYNLLTYSEDFSNAVWQVASSGGGVNGIKTPNFGVAPDGTTTACRIQLDVTPGLVNAQSQVYQNFTSFAANETYSAWVKTNDGTTKTIRAFTAGTVVPTTITVTGTWTRFDALRSATAPNDNFQFVLIKGSTSDSADLLVWHPDVRLTSTSASMPNYQRIAAATDYATAGFLPYLYFVTDDSFGTGNINFSGTDKMSVFAGVTKLSDSATAVVSELSANSGANSGVFVMFAPGSPASKRFVFNSNGNAGTVAEAATTDTTYNAPFTAVLTGQSDISGDSVTLRANATQVGSSTADQGAGNYGTYPLYIGRRNNASLPFNGNLYSLIVAGKAVSASELSATESYVATKTGVSI